MPVFVYKAYAADGRKRAGKCEAETRARATATLQAEGLRVFEIDLAAPSATSFWHRDLFGRDRVSNAGRVGFLRELATLLSAGLTVDRALSMVARQASGPLQPILADLLQRVLAGASLSKAMTAHPETFPRDMADAVRAGEATGTLVDVITTLTLSLERRDAVRRHLSSAMIYPALLVLMGIGTLIMVVTVLVPALAPLFEGSGQPAPLAIRAAKGLGDIVAAAWIPLLVGLVGGGIGLAKFWRNVHFAAARSRIAVRLPLVRDIVIGAEVGRMCRVLGTLVKAQVSIPDAIAATRPLPRNHVFRDALAQAGRRVSEGGSLAAGLSALRPYAPSTLNLIASGEQVNRLGPVLIHAADMHETRTREKIDRLLALFTPLVTICMGGLIGGLIVSVMNAILSVGQLAQ
jgi:general secretion pathway protein F